MLSHFKLKEFFALTLLSILGIVVSSFQLYGESLSRQLNTLSNNSEVLGVVSGKEGYKLRFNETTNGGLIFTGNSLCLSETAAGYGSCGTFTSTNTSLVDNEFTPLTNGTTSDWRQNSSSSYLNLPEGAEVLYAELVWGGSYKYLNADVTSELDNSVTLVTPTGEFQISPDSQTGGNIAINYMYVRTKEITDIVRQSGSGVYTLAKVPAIMVKNNPYNNSVGYTIAVAYRDDTQTARNLSIFVGAEMVGADQLTNTAEVRGFSTPSAGNVSGKLFVSALEGDHMYSGDKMRFGGDPNNLQDLSGPNNRVDNFFASQINDNNGNLDTSGTFGNKNQSYDTGNVGGVRQGWDVTAVDISSQLSNNQTAAYAQGFSTGDGYVINALGMQIDVNSAYPETTISFPGNPLSCGGSQVDVEMLVENRGSASSLDTRVSEINLPNGLTMVEGSLRVDGQEVSLPIALGDIGGGQRKVVTFKVKIAEDTTASDFEITAKVDYKYEMISGNLIQENITARNTLSKSSTCGQPIPPTALNDEATTSQDTPVTIDVIANDSDSDGQLVTETLEIVTQPNHGSVEIVNGEVVYTPNPGYTGNDEFEYRICDNDQLCDTATVRITVETNFPPIAVDDSKSTRKNTPVEINILDNDSDVDSERANWEVRIVTPPGNGQAELDSENNLIYSPNPDYVGNDQLVYEICDPDNLCDTATVTITINEENTLLPPVANDDSKSTSENTPVAIDVIANDSDSDGQLVTETLEIVTQPNHGSVEIVNGEVVYTPNPGYTGNDEFEYRICDNDQLCDTARVTINIIGDRDVEPISPVSGDVKANDDSTKTKPNTPIQIPILNNDEVTNPETVEIIVNPRNGSVIVNDDLTVTYSPNPGFTGSDTFTYRVCSNSGCDLAVVTVEVEPEGLVLGDIDSLVRSGGGAMLRLWFFIGAFALSVYGSFAVLKKGKKSDDT